MSIELFNVKIFLRHLLLFVLSLFPTFTVMADINLQGQMPVAEFFNKRHDFGEIYQGQMLSHQFRFKNTGNGTLILTSLHASCGCVNAKTFAEDGITIKNIFKPGEIGVVAVDFDSSQFAGNVVRTVTVETNSDVASPTVTLTLTANINQEITSSPAMLYLGKIQKNDEKNFFVQLKMKNHSKILGVESDLPFIRATIDSSEKNKNTERIIVQIQKTDTLPIGPFQGNLTVSNTSRFYKNLKIPIMGEVIGHVQTSTKYLEFGVVNKDRVSDRVISFHSKNQDFAITSVKVDLNNFINFASLNQNHLFDIQKTRIATKRNGDPMNEYVVKIKLKYPSTGSSSSLSALLTGLNISGSFLIETNDPDYAQIKVPFFGILKQE